MAPPAGAVGEQVAIGACSVRLACSETIARIHAVLGTVPRRGRGAERSYVCKMQRGAVVRGRLHGKHIELDEGVDRATARLR